MNRFLFVVCQAGAEAALKAEVQATWPQFRFSYSRPGFVTFRVPPDVRGEFDLKSTFARTYGFSLGKVAGTTAEQLAASARELTAGQSFDHLHIWERDRTLPGTGGFEPGPTLLAEEMGKLIVQARPAGASAWPINERAAVGQTILDCVLVEPGEWWFGFHTAGAPPSRWPGGVHRAKWTAEPISRAFYKMEEALRWSGLPLRRGDLCAEIGTAPGGAAQALLVRGASVLGIDPAEVDERLFEHPRFTHVRKRAAEMKRREFRQVRWLCVDANITPSSSLDDVEAIVTHDAVQIRGLLLTLKLHEWELAGAIPVYLARVRSWGYGYVRSRQLAYNRREFCIAALRSRAARRPLRRKS